MANYQKHKANSIGHMGKHYERGIGSDGEKVKYNNQDINSELSDLNYNLAVDQEMGHSEFIKKRTSEVKCLNRKDVTVMSSWVVTSPKTLKESEEKAFFKQSYDFLEKKYGKANVVSAYVHMDENRPHMHFAFVPVVKDKKKGHLKVSAKECVNKYELKRFHNDLSKHMENYFGRDIGILNEATIAGNKSINELKRESAIETIEKTKEITNDMILKAQQKAIKCEETIEKRISSSNTQLKGLECEYVAKKGFLDHCTKTSELSMMYPDYVEITKKGLLKKKEMVIVPKDKWEAKHISQNQVSAVIRERDLVEERIKKFKDSLEWKNIEKLEKQIKNLKAENKELNQSLNKSIRKTNKITKVFEKYPEIKEQFEDAAKEISKSINRNIGMQR